MTSYPLRSDRVARPHGLFGAHSVRRLRLLPSGDGWSLVGADGALVFSALGLEGRRRCLEYAQAAGVVALAS
jgi:hypothetical protein